MSPEPPGSEPHRGRERLERLGWALALAALLWAYAVHQGIGPAPYGVELAWYEPRGFLRGGGLLDRSLVGTPLLLTVLALPSLLLATGVFLASRSALARTLVVSAAVAVLLFGYYGHGAARVWQLFSWRGSAVLATTALALGVALSAPLLARSWLRQGWPVRLATYLPSALVAVAFVRNATGTDPELRFALSPWPAVPLYGLEVGGLFAMLCWAGAALAALSVQRAGPRRAVVPGVAAGLLAPLALLWLCDRAELLPFHVDGHVAAVLLALCALASAAALLPVRGRPEALAGRRLALAVGAALLALPILGGQAWARLDYTRTREQRAREIIDALDRYAARETLYPDDLGELVAAGDLPAVPRPAIGFALLGEQEFGFSSFGTSYLLEFAAPRWVQCAYAPPYREDPGEAEATEAPTGGAAATQLEEAWSCPGRPPELW